MDEYFAAIAAGDVDAVRRGLAADPCLATARDPSGATGVLVAIYRGRSDVAAAIREHHRDLDVFEAAAAGDLDRLRALVEAAPTLANAYAPDGFHPLGLAAFFRHRDVAGWLLEHGADPALPSRNPLRVTALHSAVATDAGPRDMDLVRLLVDAGAPLDAPHGGGGTPLHTAAFIGDVEVVRLLLERGADARVRTDDGRTAAEIARERGHTEVARLLAGSSGGPARPA